MTFWAIDTCAVMTNFDKPSLDKKWLCEKQNWQMITHLSLRTTTNLQRALVRHLLDLTAYNAGHKPIHWLQLASLRYCLYNWVVSSFESYWASPYLRSSYDWLDTRLHWLCLLTGRVWSQPQWQSSCGTRHPTLWLNLYALLLGLLATWNTCFKRNEESSGNYFASFAAIPFGCYV